MALLPNHILISVLFRNIVQLESENPRYIAIRGLGRNQLGVDLEEHVWETATKVGAVDGGMASRLWVVDVLTTAAEQLHRLCVRSVRECNGEQRVIMAKYSGTASKVALFELFQLV